MTGKKDTERRERPKRESVINLTRFLDKNIHVKFQGGRESSGKLKGFDHLLNLVLDDTTEYLKDQEDGPGATAQTRHLGLTICRGPAITVICPQDGHEAIENPFLNIE